MKNKIINPKTPLFMLHLVHFLRFRQSTLWLVFVIMTAVSGYSQNDDMLLSLDSIPRPIPVNTDKEILSILDKISRTMGIPNKYYLDSLNYSGTITPAIDFMGTKSIHYNPKRLNYVSCCYNHYWYVTEKLAYAVWMLEHTKEYNDNPGKKVLMAEKYAGEVLYKMGATLDELQSVYSLFVPEISVYNLTDGTPVKVYIHPSDKFRALRAGWQEAQIASILTRNYCPSDEDWYIAEQLNNPVDNSVITKIKFKDLSITKKTMGDEAGLWVKSHVQISKFRKDFVALVRIKIEGSHTVYNLNRYVHIKEGGPGIFKFFIPYWEMGLSRNFARSSDLSLQAETLSGKKIGKTKKYNIYKSLLKDW